MRSSLNFSIVFLILFYPSSFATIRNVNNNPNIPGQYTSTSAATTAQLFVRFADVSKKWGIPEGRSFFINIYTFIGNGSWSTPSNWTNNLIPPNVISASDEVLINHAPGGQCNFTGSISVLNGGKLEVQSGKVLNIAGNLNNDGALTGTGTVNFNGAGLADLSSTGTITTILQLTNKQIQLTGNTNTSTINLISGSNITLNGFDLNMGSASLTANNSNYIITNGTGSLNRNVSTSPVTFPVGVSGTSYNPVNMTNSGALDSFSVRVTEGVLSSINPAEITIGAVNRTWVIDEGVSGGSNMDITFQWNTSDEQQGFNRANSYVASVCPPPPSCLSGYELLQGSAASGTGTYTLSRNAITDFNLSDTFIVRTTPVLFTFTGDGNWNTPGNWSGGLVPITPIKPGWEVTIDPPTGQCNFTGDLIIEKGAILRVQPGKILNVTGNIVQQ